MCITSNWTGKTDMTRKNGKVNKKVMQIRPMIVLALSSMLVLMYATVAYGAFFDTAGQSARPMGMGEVFLSQREMHRVIGIILLDCPMFLDGALEYPTVLSILRFHLI